MDTVSEVRKGGSWLLEDVKPSEVFTPEKLSDEHRLMAQTTDEFIDTEVLPKLDQLETKDWQLARTLMRRCGELGLLGVNVPEQYGGLDLDKVSSLIVAERIARSASFATSYGGQANLCILPLVLFGTDAQKQAYLPKLVSGEWVGAYALSESGSGSDALAARTRATRAADGSWTLNGEKIRARSCASLADAYFSTISPQPFRGENQRRLDAMLAQDLSGVTVLLVNDSKQQMLGRNKLVLHLVCLCL